MFIHAKHWYQHWLRSIRGGILKRGVGGGYFTPGPAALAVSGDWGGPDLIGQGINR